MYCNHSIRRHEVHKNRAHATRASWYIVLNLTRLNTQVLVAGLGSIDCNDNLKGDHPSYSSVKYMLRFYPVLRHFALSVCPQLLHSQNYKFLGNRAKIGHMAKSTVLSISCGKTGPKYVKWNVYPHACTHTWWSVALVKVPARHLVASSSRNAWGKHEHVIWAAGNSALH